MATPSTIPALKAKRTGPKTYTVRSQSGAELQIGALGAEGSFSPVELLQAAVAGCVGLSAEAQLVSRLGEDFEATSTVEAVKHADANRLEQLTSQMTVDFSQLDEAATDKLIASAERFIAQLCTVKRTLSHGVAAASEVQAR